MEFEIAYTNKEITPWGGMVLFRQMLAKMKFSSAVESCADLPQPSSNRGYKPLSVIESFMVSIWCGANRFLHTEVTRQNLAICKIFGWKQMPGNDAFKRSFRKFRQADSQRVSDFFTSGYSTTSNLTTIRWTVIQRSSPVMGSRKGLRKDISHLRLAICPITPSSPL